VQQLLDELHNTGIPIALASSGSSRRVHNILDSLRLRDYFATVVTGDDVAIGKPHPAIFRKAAAQLQIQPFESLVFEDSVSGVQAAKAAGMKCLGIADHHRANALRQAGAERVFLNFLHASLGQIQKSLLEIQ